MQGEERSHNPHLTPAERELEDALRGLSPAASKIDRDRLLFQAGAVAGSRERSWRWGYVAATLTIGLVLSVLWKQPPTVIERVVIKPATTGESIRLAQAQSSQEVASTKPASAPLRYQPVPIRVPTGPFVAAPPGFVNMPRVEFVSDARRSTYFMAIQDVVQRGIGAIPSTRTTPANRKGVAVEADLTPADAASPRADGELHPS